jgi:hypothetical protein
MHQYSVWVPLESISPWTSLDLSRGDRRKQYLLITTDYFTKWLEVYTIPNQESCIANRAATSNLGHARGSGTSGDK